MVNLCVHLLTVFRLWKPGQQCTSTSLEVVYEWVAKCLWKKAGRAVFSVCASMHLLIWLAGWLGRGKDWNYIALRVGYFKPLQKWQRADCRFASPVRGELPPRSASATGQIAAPLSPAPPHAVCTEQQRSVQMLCATSPGEATNSGVALMLVIGGSLAQAAWFRPQQHNCKLLVW